MPNCNTIEYKKQFQFELKKLIPKLQNTLNQKQNKANQLNWCLENNEYFSNFLSLKQLGRTPLEKVINTILLKLSSHIWKKSLYKKVTNKVILSLKSHYLPREFKNFENKQELIAVTLLQVRLFFKSICNILKNGSLVDLMNISSSILHCIQTALPFKTNFYLLEKRKQNILCLRTYKEIRNEVIKHPYNILLATLIAVKANFIDSSIENVDAFLYGFFDELNEWLDSDILTLIDSNSYPNFDYYSFITSIETGKKNILYELDNCGEVIFDLLLVELLLKKGHSITLCAKRDPLLNDITENRLKKLLNMPILKHLKKYLKTTQLSIIHNNSSIVGKSLFEVNDNYKKHYKKADILLLKGQGHLLNMPLGTKTGKSLISFQYKKPIFYMLTIKSEIIDYALKEMYKNPVPTKSEIVLKYHP